MTREEAIDIFEHNWTRLVNPDYTEEELNKAFGIALKALEQEPCGDAISKQAVLDATVKRNSIWNKITNSKGENLEEIILQLPSVKPQNDVLNKIRAEIAENGNSDINAQTVLAIIDKYRGESEGKNE